MKKIVQFIVLVLVLIGSASCVSAKKAEQEKVVPPKEYVEWLDDLKKDMISKGVSSETINKVYEKDYYKPEPEAVKFDRKQAEFVMTSVDYLNRVVTEKRVKEAQKKYKELYPTFKDMEKKYGVGFNYIVAFWGIETNFGQTFGNFQVIEVLTQLAYDKRRRKFFTNELYQALKIIDKYKFDYTSMESSWAGAMGNFQFMPSTFNAYAVDYDGDGKIDIWHSFGDASASASNYLSEIGWVKNDPWGMQVNLPWNFDYSQTGRQKLKTVAEWKKLGINTGKLDAKLKAALITPEGNKGNAYLILDNFKVIMQWNRSENYALAVSTLAEYIKTGKKWKKLEQIDAVHVKSEDVSKVQAFINKFGFDDLDEDGQLGTKTREAIKELQKKANLPQDGYPDYKLLDKMSNYNPEVGFVIPVQPVKPKR